MVKEFQMLVSHSILYCSKAAVQNHVRWEYYKSIVVYFNGFSRAILRTFEHTLLFRTAASKGLANHRAGRSVSKRSHNVNALCMCNGIPLQLDTQNGVIPFQDGWLEWALCASTVCRAPWKNDMELPGCQVDSQRLCGDWCQEEVSSASGAVGPRRGRRLERHRRRLVQGP